MKRMNVLITGGTGFIGSRLALKCLHMGHRVRVLGQENTPAEAVNRELIQAEGTEIVVGSVTDTAKVIESLHGIDIVYHLAAAQHEANVPDQIFWDVNVTGTRNLIEASFRAGVKRFVHGSTIGVYGSALNGRLDEDSPLRPDNVYGITKLEAEKVVLSYKDRIPVVVVRISETYGPGDRRLLKLFKMIKKNTFFMIGNGKNLHHPIYIDDLIDGLFLVATSPEAVAKVFVLPGRESLSTNEMVEAIVEAVGGKSPRLRAPLLPFLLVAAVLEGILKPLRIQPPLHRRRMDFFRKTFVFSHERAQTALSFMPKVTFKQGALETARWYAEMGAL